ncbi:MAG: hypothetical protein M1819_002940 [Sarea resinae]|nr:MAG: hypothetical protein M1819_002940 [Sarea resinae]
MVAIQKFNVKRVAVIGAGPAGLAAAKYLLAEKAFEKIDVIEQQSTPTGIWKYSPENGDGLEKVPQTDPHTPVEKPRWRSAEDEAVGKGNKREATFVTPLYERLETNIPKTIMRFSDLAFPEEAQLFPKHDTVAGYLEEYSKDVRHLIKFQTQVLDVRPSRAPEGQETWLVKTLDLQAGEEKEEVYDAVVVANGHYSVPYIPDIQGLAEWNKRYPGVVSHSKSFRTPDAFKDKKVIVVGNSASGLDIGSQISTVSKLPLISSERSASYLSPGPQQNKEEYPEIVEFILDQRSVRFANGHIEKDIDAIVFCTGYLYSLPFIPALEPPPVSDGTHIQHVYKHIFYIYHPTLAFVALPQKVIPFPTSEAQAAVVARVWSGRLALPSQSTMGAWEDSVVDERGAGREYHTLMFPLDADNINDLREWSEQAERRKGLDNNGLGKLPPFWDEKERWTRERFPAIKKAFMEKGEARHDIRTMEELGFDFEAWKRENESASSLL